MKEVWSQPDDLLIYKSLPLPSDQEEKLKDISFACKPLYTQQNDTSKAYTQSEVSPFDNLTNLIFKNLLY